MISYHVLIFLFVFDCMLTVFYYYTWWNNVEQPPLSDGGLTPGGDLFGSHGLNYTSPPEADMVSGSSLMEGSLAPGRQACVSLHFLYNYLHPISISHEKINY